jgi:hypothetical protein
VLLGGRHDDADVVLEGGRDLAREHRQVVRVVEVDGELERHAERAQDRTIVDARQVEQERQRLHPVVARPE